MKNFLKIALSTAIFLSASASFAADMNDMLALESGFQQLSAGLQAPRLRAASAPATVAEETTRATAAEEGLENDISAEASARESADSVLQGQITTNAGKIAQNASDISAEASARESADSVLQGQITTNAGKIAQNASDISAEASARESADSVLQGQITTNAGKIGDMNFTNTQYIKNDRDLSSAVRTLDANFAQMSNRLDDLDSKVEKHHKEMKRGFASLAAMTRLVPNAKSKCNTQLALGMGHYRGTTGVAVGLFHYVDNNTLINAGVGYAGHDSTTFGVGITFGF